jgi:hypothetical protein
MLFSVHKSTVNSEICIYSDDMQLNKQLKIDYMLVYLGEHRYFESQPVQKMKVMKVKSHEIHESHESCESDWEQAFPQEYSSNGNFVLVSNNSRDRMHIYDFSKDESVKTINWYQLVRVFSMFHTPFNLTLSSRDHRKNHLKNHRKNHRKSSQKHHRDKFKSYQSIKVLKC